MGMYNEVFCACPECGGRGYMQISQLVLGFGGFDLENYDTLEDLSTDDILELKARVLNKDFVCDDCGYGFSPYKDKDRELLIRKLFEIDNTNLEETQICCETCDEPMFKLSSSKDILVDSVNDYKVHCSACFERRHL